MQTAQPARIHSGMFTSRSDEWFTPNDLFAAIDGEFHFTIDVAASASNAKCDRFYTIEQNGLLQSWAGERVWCNPPYSEIAQWVEKAHSEVAAEAIVLLIPARTDTRWFHGFILGIAEVRFIKGRVKFGGGKSNAPFPSMLVIYRAGDRAERAQQGLFNSSNDAQPAPEHIPESCTPQADTNDASNNNTEGDND